MAVTRAGPGRRSRHEGLRALVWGTRKWGCAVTAPSPRLAVNGTEKWQALRFRFKALHKHSSSKYIYYMQFKNIRNSKSNKRSIQF